MSKEPARCWRGSWRWRWSTRVTLAIIRQWTKLAINVNSKATTLPTVYQHCPQKGSKPYRVRSARKVLVEQLEVLLHPTPTTRILHPTPCTLHPTPNTLHPTPYTLQTTPYTLHPTPFTLHPTLEARTVSEAPERCWWSSWRWRCSTRESRYIRFVATNRPST